MVMNERIQVVVEEESCISNPDSEKREVSTLEMVAMHSLGQPDKDIVVVEDLSENADIEGVDEAIVA